jgi:heme-degrading monooxygenase HmoA
MLPGKGSAMYAVIFQVEPKPGRGKDYLDIAATLRAELDKIDGFISVERFESVSNSGKYVSLSFWRDEAAILAWRTHVGHQRAQRKGRGEVFADYRLSVVQIVRDYGMTDREDAPEPVEPSWGEDFPF